MIFLCGHCGSTTGLITRDVYEHKEPDYDLHNDEWIFKKNACHIFECSTCSKPTLIEYDYGLDSIDIKDWKGFVIYPPVDVEDWKDLVIYPTANIPLDNLPKKIERAYTAAIKVKNIEPNACAVLVERTLEAACNHEQAQGRTLAQKLNYLAENGRIRYELAKMACGLKELKNLDAHDDEGEFTEKDMPIIIDFLETILECLYVVPTKIEVVRAWLTKDEIFFDDLYDFKAVKSDDEADDDDNNENEVSDANMGLKEIPYDYDREEMEAEAIEYKQDWDEYTREFN